MTQGYRSMDTTTKGSGSITAAALRPMAPPSSEEARRDNVLILGLRKAGKSSSFQVVYESLNPEDALQEGVTQAHKSEPYNIDTFHRMRIWDGTSNFSYSSSSPRAPSAGQNQQQQAGQKQTQSKGAAASPSAAGGANDALDRGKGKTAFGTGDQLYWTECSAVIFVVDSQGEYSEALDRLNDVILSAYAHNPLIHFHVFVHKADGHSSDYRNDTLQDIQQRVADNLQDSSPSFFFAPTAQEILAEAAAAQDAFAQSQQQQQQPPEAEQATSAMYYSTSSVGRYNAMQSNFTASGLPSAIGHELDHDVRLSFHVTSILDCSINIAWSRVQMDLMNVEVSKTLESICNGLCNSSKLEKVYLFDVPSKTYISADGSPFDEATFDVISDYITFLVRFSGLYSNIKQGQQQQHQKESKAERYSTSTLKLAPDTTLCFHQIRANLALVYVVRNDLQAKNAGMIEYNVSIARRAIIDTHTVYTCS